MVSNGVAVHGPNSTGSASFAQDGGGCAAKCNPLVLWLLGAPGCCRAWTMPCPHAPDACSGPGCSAVLWGRACAAGRMSVCLQCCPSQEAQPPDVPMLVPFIACCMYRHHYWHAPNKNTTPVLVVVGAQGYCSVQGHRALPLRRVTSVAATLLASAQLQTSLRGCVAMRSARCGCMLVTFGGSCNHPREGWACLPAHGDCRAVPTQSLPVIEVQA